MAPVTKSASAKKTAAGSAAPDYSAVFATLRDVFADVLPDLQALKDTEAEYTLHTKVPSPFKQHKGAPIFFSSVRKGKAYASFHLFPLYMNPELTATISPELKKRMQGLTCFNFKTEPEPALLAELKKLTKAGLKNFKKRGWA